MAVAQESLQTFTSDNQFFALGVMICNDKEHYTLNRNYIQSFEYVNQINTPWLEGRLVYEDTNLALDKFIGSKKTICMVSFNGVDFLKDGRIETSKSNPDNSMCHKFMVESINIVDTPAGDADVEVNFDDEEGGQSKPDVKSKTYEITLKSNFYQEFIQVISYSNMENGPETITDIYRNLLQLRGFGNLAPDGGKTTNQIDYITENNDTLQTAFTFLMNKLYYFGSREDSMQFLVYDEIKDQFRFVDLSKPDTYVKDIRSVPVKDVVVSMFDGSTERLVSEGIPVGFGMLTQTKISDALTTMYTQQNVTYDPETNDWKVETVQTNRLNDYFNAQPVTSEVAGGMQMEVSDIPQYNNHYNIFEQNSSNIWYDQITNFMFCNGLIVSSTGQINLRPGMTIVVKITDKDISQSQSDTVKDAKAVECAGNGIENEYFVTRVRHKLVKNEENMIFTNNICLAKNYDWNRKKDGKMA